MLPALAGLLPAFTLESATVATAVSGFFTYLWQENIKNADSYDFSFDAELEKIPVEYAKLDNSIIEQTNSSVDNFQTAIETYANGFQEKQEISVSNTMQQVQAKTSLIDVLKSSNIEMIEQQKILNNNLAKQNEILLKTLEAKGLEVINQNKLIAILSENLQSLNISVATLATLPKITATNSEYSLIMQSQIIEAIQNLKLTTGTINVNPSVHVDTAPLAKANETIASGVEDQKATNAKIVENLAKKNEQLDFLKNGSDSLKDSNGNAIKPQEVQAKINAEQLIEQADTNKTTFDDIKDFVGEAFGTVEDTLEKALGDTDGFDLNFNPLSYIDEILMKDFIENKDNYYPQNKA